MEFTTRLERNNYDKHISQSYTNPHADDLSPTYSLYTHTDEAGIVSFDRGQLVVEEDSDSYSVVYVNYTGTVSSPSTPTNTSTTQIMGMEHISAWLELAFSDADEDVGEGEGGLSEPNNDDALTLTDLDTRASDTQLVGFDSDAISPEDSGDVDLEVYDNEGHNSDLSSAHMPISSLNVTYLCPTCHRKFTSYQACTHHRHARRHGSPTQLCTLDWERSILPHSCASAHLLSPIDSHSGWCDLKGPKRYESQLCNTYTTAYIYTLLYIHVFIKMYMLSVCTVLHCSIIAE